jgi:hypothetical protein
MYKNQYTADPPVNVEGRVYLIYLQYTVVLTSSGAEI